MPCVGLSRSGGSREREKKKCKKAYPCKWMAILLKPKTKSNACNFENNQQETTKKKNEEKKNQSLFT